MFLDDFFRIWMKVYLTSLHGVEVPKVGLPGVGPRGVGVGGCGCGCGWLRREEEGRGRGGRGERGWVGVVAVWRMGGGGRWGGRGLKEAEGR